MSHGTNIMDLLTICLTSIIFRAVTSLRTCLAMHGSGNVRVQNWLGGFTSNGANVT